MRTRTGTGVGASSIILIVVVLSMTVFGTLTLQTARLDQRLTERAFAAAEAYYQADARAQELLAAVDAALARGEPLPAGVEAEADGRLGFTVDIDETRLLRVELDAAGGRAVVLAWAVESAAPWAPDETLDLF